MRSIKQQNVAMHLTIKFNLTKIKGMNNETQNSKLILHDGELSNAKSRQYIPCKKEIFCKKRVKENIFTFLG